MLAPMVDGVFQVCVRSNNVGFVCVVVEGSGSQVRDLGLASASRALSQRRRPYMSETIPLGPALRVQRVHVVIGFPRGQGFYLVFEGFSMEAGDLWDIHG